MRIRFDRTPNSVVAVCDCGWRALTLTVPAADVLATSHVMATHPASERLAYMGARKKRNQRRGGQ